MKSKIFHHKLMSKIFFISIFALFSIDNAFWMTITNSSTFETNCPWAIVNESIYIASPTQKIYPTDLIRSSGKLLFIRTEETDVRIWQNTTWTLSAWCYKLLDWTWTWWGRLSNVVQWNSQYVWAFKIFWNICDALKVKRTNTSLPSVQFVYKVAVKEELSKSTGTSSYFYYPYTSWTLASTQSFIPDQTKRNWGNVIYHANECHNFIFNFCWDWILDSWNWETCDDWNNVNWDSCSATCQTTVTPSIQIDKRDANPADLDWIIWTNDSQTVNVWSGATFRIRVTNNWTESLRNLVLTDVIAPNCAGNVTLPSTYPGTWSGFTTLWSWNHTNNILEPWEYFEYTCSRANTAIWYTNSATVTWAWVTSWTSVNATDTTVVIIPTVVTTTCNNLSATPSSWNAPLTSVFNCSATGATSYRIEIFSWSTIASWAIAINTINTNTWSYTFSNTWSYIARCTINWNITSTACQAPVSVTTAWPTCWTAWWYTFPYNETSWWTRTFCSVGTPSPNPPTFPSQWWSTSWTCNWVWSPVTCVAYRWTPWWGWWGGWGWSWPSCVRISVPSLELSWSWKAISSTWSVNYTCYWNTHVWNIWIDCDLDWDWNTKTINYQSTATLSWTYRYANFTCTYTDPNKTYRPRCYVGSASTTITTWSRSDLACWTTLSVWQKICWDWVVQRPNDAWINEECEKVLNPVTWVMEFPAWCVACKTSNFTLPDVDPPIITIPDWWSVEIYPLDRSVIIWQWSDPIISMNLWEPYIYNNSSSDIYLSYPLCVYKTNNNLVWTTPYCSWNIWWLYPWVSRKITYTTAHFTWAVVPSTLNYLDSKLKVTLWNISWFNYTTIWPFFTKTIDVRVSKPAIATVWWWTTLVKNTTKTADINKVASSGYSDPDKNKNFVWAWISTWSLSSYSKSVTWSTSVVNISSWTTNQVNTNTSKIVGVSDTWHKDIDDADIPNYNWISNVYIVKRWNLTIISSISWFWPRTYIVEGWNLYINQDINYSDNIAFVVKWWNIIIASNVKNINWTYISIPVSWVWWKIKSASSSTRLLINWSLYWDISELVANRTYVQNDVNNIINVWTVVSFGSNMFRKPAPLVWDFIWEYMKSKKVAK